MNYTGWNDHVSSNLDISSKLEYIIANKSYIPYERFHWVRRVLKNVESYDISLDNWDAKIYDDDPDDKIDREEHTYCWLLDEYQSEDYSGEDSGEGQRIGIRKSDGKLVYGWTSHCSCNDPWEDGDADLKQTESTNKLLDIDIDNLSGVDWGEQFVKNVNWLYDYIVKATKSRPFIPYNVSGSSITMLSGACFSGSTFF